MATMKQQKDSECTMTKNQNEMHDESGLFWKHLWVLHHAASPQPWFQTYKHAYFAQTVRASATQHQRHCETPA